MNIIVQSIASTAVAVMLFSSTAGARELDREKTVGTEQIEAGRNLPQTLVVRYKKGSRRAEVVHLHQALKPGGASRDLVSTSSFMRLDARGKELDRDSSSSSWLFGYRGWGLGYAGYGYGGAGCGYYASGCYPYYASTYYPSYYYPSYGYGGYYYSYMPYYSYYLAPYYYSYYGWPYTNPYCYY